MTCALCSGVPGHKWAPAKQLGRHRGAISTRTVLAIAFTRNRRSKTAACRPGRGVPAGRMCGEIALRCLPHRVVRFNAGLSDAGRHCLQTAIAVRKPALDMTCSFQRM